ncbi:MAG: zinc ribbon domain-containing protein [Gemmatimonadetes bacterium]|nr:zinc ribbon domain-containing protein [Gemmatimonadota bacterium]
MGVLAAALVLTAASVWIVLHPILRGRAAPLADEEVEPSDADFRKRTALRALRDAEYDRLAGKLNEDDFRALRAELAAEALQAIRADGREAAVEADASGAVAEADELEISRYRLALRSDAVCGRCAHANEPGSRFCTRCGAPLRRGRCAACGERLVAGSESCPACGAPAG